MPAVKPVALMGQLVQPLPLGAGPLARAKTKMNKIK